MLNDHVNKQLAMFATHDAKSGLKPGFAATCAVDVPYLTLCRASFTQILCSRTAQTLHNPTRAAPACDGIPARPASSMAVPVTNMPQDYQMTKPTAGISLMAGMQ